MKKVALNSWVEGYLDYMSDVLKKNHRTVVDIRSTLKKLNDHFLEINSTTDLWHLSFKDYLKWVECERFRGKSVKTISKQLSHVRGFLNYMLRNEKCDRNVLEGFHLKDDKEVEPEYLELEEIEKLISVLDVNNKNDRRNRIMIILLYGCGLRTMELCGLDIKDIDREHQEIHIRHAKGDLERQIPVPDAVWTELLAYISERRWVGGALFRTTHKNKRIDSKALSNVLSEKVLKAGIGKKVTPKALRHTFATHLMDRGVDLAVIASLMGHRSPRETGVYLHQLKGRKEEAIKSMKIFETTEGDN